MPAKLTRNQLHDLYYSLRLNRRVDTPPIRAIWPAARLVATARPFA